MPDLGRCNLCGAVLRVVHYPGWGNEPVKHECRPTQHPLETQKGTASVTGCAITDSAT